MVDDVCQYIGDDSELFAELMSFMIQEEDAKLSMRASWVFSHLGIEYPNLIIPYYKNIVNILERDGFHPGMHRNVLRVLMRVDIPKRWRMKVLDECCRLIMRADTAIAAVCNAMNTAFNMAKSEPDLLEELKMIISENPRKHLGGGYKVRKMEILTEIDKIIG